MKVTVTGKMGWMMLDPTQLRHPTNISEEYTDKFDATKKYRLHYYAWNPVGTDMEDKLIAQLGKSWASILKGEFLKHYMVTLAAFVAVSRNHNPVFPASDKVFKAFRDTPYEKVKVVILGQDPYHNGCADGLAFSCSGMQIPASLKVIFKELNREYPDYNENRLPLLEDWASQGVLLLNTILTVDENKALSHANQGWETFTSYVLTHLNKKDVPIVFVLWGSNAKKYENLITNDIHLILKSGHPAADLYGNGTFFGGNDHFKKINSFLMENYNIEIKW